ncbi:MAG: transaldolase family protein [Octadecabacter sp.]
MTDWHKAQSGAESYAPHEDPGVLSVREIFEYYKSQGVQTIIMGASFRNTGQIKALAGCDNLTISPELLEELGVEQAQLQLSLSPGSNPAEQALPVSETQFRWDTSQDAAAHHLLADGIRKFDQDHAKMVALVSAPQKHRPEA